jgi:hypothetical protein
MSASLSPRSPSGGGRPTRQRLDDLEALLQRMLDLPVTKVEPGVPPESTEPEEPARGDRPVLTLLRPSGTSYSAPEEKSLPPALSALPAATADPVPPEEEGLAMKASAPADAEGPGPSPPKLSLADLEVAAADLPVAPSPPALEAKSAPSVESSAPEEWVPFSSNWRPSSQTWGPLRESWQKSQAPEPPAPARQPPRSEPPESASAAAEPGAASTATRLLLPATLEEPSASPEPDETDPDALPTPTRSTDLPPLPWWAWALAVPNAVFDLAVTPLGAPGRWLRSKKGKDLLGVVGILALAVAAGLVAADWYGWTW